MSDKTEGNTGYQHDQVLGHDFDGIEEYDNRLPNWWLFILYASIVFSFGYWLYYHTFQIGPSSEDRYAQVMQAAAEAQLARASEGGVTNESLQLAAGLPERVAEGASLYKTYCVACHSTKGEGGVGPNLTDDYWIHGGQPLDIYETLMEGVLAKGMPAWGSQLGPKRVEDLTAHLLAEVVGTQVPGKAPEGEPYQPPVEGGDEATEPAEAEALTES